MTRVHHAPAGLRNAGLYFLLFAILCLKSESRQQATGRGADLSIRTQSAEVLVDVVVTDKHNRLVTTLKPEDFVLYESGVRKEIASFRLVRSSSAVVAAKDTPVAETTRPRVENQPTQRAAGPPLNVMVMLLDYATTEFVNQKLVREAAVKYVEEKLRPTDYVSIFALGTRLRFLSDFTNDKQQLVTALKTSDARGSTLAAETASLDGTIANARGAALDGDSTTVDVPSGPGGAEVGAARSAQGSSQAMALIAQRIEAQYVALKSAVQKQQTRDVLTAIRAVALGVRHIEGRKSMVLFSQGFVVGEQLEGELHAVTDAANRSHLTIYSIDSRGLTTREMGGGLAPKDEITAVIARPQRQRMEVTAGESIFDRVLEVGRDVRESALRYVSNATGGALIRNTNDLGSALARIDEEEHAYYLLSYRPDVESYDGKFRELRVDVLQPGLSVRARSGYYAIPAEYDFLTPEEYATVVAAQAGASPLPLFVRAGGFREEQERYRIPVVIEIPAATLQFDKDVNGNVTRLQVVGIVRDPAKNPVAQFGGERQFSATQNELRALRPGSLSFLETVRLRAGTYSVLVAVRDVKSGRAGFLEQPLLLTSPSASLALSTILLAKTAEKGNVPTEQFLTAGGVRILPSAQCDFRNGENLIYYLDVYGFQTRNNQPDLLVTLRLASNGVIMPFRLPEYAATRLEPAGTARLTLARYVQLAGLKPGNYALLVDVRDRITGRAVHGQAAFSVRN